VKENQKDIVLIERILQGDKSAYAPLINRHKSYAFTVAFRILNNREDAEEVANDAFMQAFGALKTYNKEAKFTTWFYRIVFNAALMQKRRHRILGDEISETTDYQAVTSYFDSSKELQNVERKQFIQKAMQLLSPDDVTVITLFYLKENSLEEISEITGISAETAKVKLYRARKRMAETMQQLMGNEVKSLY
jgi:RNA polymerase sigma factor (sigma-70 family)